MSDDSLDPLVKRVDALTRRQESPRAKGEVPVLTEVVSEENAPRRAVDHAALEALSRELERAVLERLGPEIERLIEERLARHAPEFFHANPLQRTGQELTVRRRDPAALWQVATRAFWLRYAAVFPLQDFDTHPPD